MHGEHLEHEEHVRVLIETCDTLKATPETLGHLRERLLNAAATLEREFAAHLKREEDLIFPAIRSLLSPEQQAAMLTELRDRRNSRT
jgi:iron-sulfur cluster repair protein YtfE (RIC family)